MSESLVSIYQRHRVTGPDAGHGDLDGTHSYGETYERLLAPYRVQEGKYFSMMEIGVAHGLALAMWREYVPRATIVGVDLSFVFDTKPHEASGTILIAADATKPEFLDKLGHHTFDFIREDASHQCADQCATFKLLKGRMRIGGLYVIEDVLCPESCVPNLNALHDRVETYDLRKNKGRFDDFLWVARF